MLVMPSRPDTCKSWAPQQRANPLTLYIIAHYDRDLSCCRIRPLARQLADSQSCFRPVLVAEHD